MAHHQWKLSALKLMSVAPIAALGFLAFPVQAHAKTEAASMTSEANANLQQSSEQQGITGESANFTEVRQGRLQILIPTHMRRVESCQSRCSTCQSRCSTCQSRCSTRQ